MRDKSESFFILCLAALAFIIYLPALNAPFLFDDSHMIVNNVFIKNTHYFQWLWKGYVTSAAVPKGMCRPLLMTSFIFNYLAAGLSASGFRIINILFHFLNATLFYFLLKTLKKDAPPALLFFISFIFLLHPINSEAVIYLSCRSDLMVTFFILAGIILWVKEKRGLALLMYIPALLTKETALCFPIMLFAYEYIKNGLKGSLSKKNIIFYGALAAITAAYFIYSAAFFAPTSRAILRSAYENVLVQSAVTFLYLKLFFLIQPINFLHNVPELKTFFEPQAFIGVLTVTAVIAAIFVLRKKRPLAALGLAWFAAGLIPKFYARLSFVAMEHHMYLASLGLCLAIFSAIFIIYQKQKLYCNYILAGIVAVLALLTFLRSFEYRNPFIFWRITAGREPDIGAVHNNLGIEYVKRGLDREAEKEFESAVKIGDRKESIVFGKMGLADILRKEKKYDEALKLIQESIELNKIPPPGAYETMGVIYMDTAKPEEAVKAWQTELNLYPGSIESAMNLGIFYFKNNDLARAELFFRKIIAENPEYALGYYGLAQIMEKENRLADAAVLYQKALRLNPNSEATHYFLGSVLARLGDEHAIGHFKAAIKINPRYCQARNDLAVAYASLTPPRWDLAKQEIEQEHKNGCVANNSLKALIDNNLAKQ